MGADIHLCLGRIKPPRLMLTDQRTDPPTETDTQLSAIVGMQLRRSDIELIECPDVADLARDYQLFAWLAGVRSDIKPLHRNLEERREKTLRLAELLDFDSEGYLNGIDYGKPGHCGIGDHSFNFVTISELEAFDFDQRIARGDEENGFVTDLSDPTTYRMLFTRNYGKGHRCCNIFQLMDYCKAHNWQFIIFGFDN